MHFHIKKNILLAVVKFIQWPDSQWSQYPNEVSISYIVFMFRNIRKLAKLQSEFDH